MNRVLFLLLAVISLSCADLKPKEVDLYFDLKSLLVEQAEHLELETVELEKSAIVNGDSSASTFTPDSLGWADEFQIIMDADINKPALRGQYSVSEINDQNSNLKIQLYEANKEEFPVQSLKIYYLNNIEKLKRIEIIQRESNSIFQSSKTIVLNVDEIKKENRITYYTVSGHQKMLLQDRVDFNIKCKLKY